MNFQKIKDHALGYVIYFGIALLGILLFAGIQNGCSYVQDLWGWQLFHSEEGRFTVRMPKDPTQKTLQGRMNDVYTDLYFCYIAAQIHERILLSVMLTFVPFYYRISTPDGPEGNARPSINDVIGALVFDVSESARWEACGFTPGMRSALPVMRLNRSKRRKQSLHPARQTGPWFW